MESGSVEVSDNSLQECEDDTTEDGRSPLNGSVFGKSRKPNWSNHEIRALIEGYDRNRAVLRSRGIYKGTGERAVNNAKRQTIWEKIAMEVNKSRPDIVSLGPHSYTNCVRTVKEVVKKWVNLVNRMKSDIAIQKSNPRYELGATSHAVYTIVSKDEPLLFRESPTAGEQLMVKEEPAGYYDEDSIISAEEDHADFTQAQYLSAENSYSDGIQNFVNDTVNCDAVTPKPRASFVPSNVKAAILKRRLQQNGGNGEPEAEVMGPSSAKKQDFPRENSVDESFLGQSRVSYEDFENVGANDGVTDESEEHLKATYKLNKDIMELQKRKLEVEVERMVVEKEKAEIEKEQLLIEKEMALLRKEKLQMEVEQFRETMNKKERKTTDQ